MPGWMQAFANHQPLTYMSDTVRLLTEGHAATAAGWSVIARLPPGVVALVGRDLRGLRPADRMEAAPVLKPQWRDVAVQCAAWQSPQPKRPPTHPYTLSIDVGGTGLKASVLSKDGTMVADRVKVGNQVPVAPRGETGLVAALTALVKPLPAADRISCGFPGMVRNGLVLSAPHFVTKKGPGTAGGREARLPPGPSSTLRTRWRPRWASRRRSPTTPTFRAPPSSGAMGSRSSSLSARVSAARSSTTAT